MIHEIYIKNNEFDKECLAIGVKINNKEFAVSCKRNLKQVAGGIEATLNTLKLIKVFGDKALTESGDVNEEFVHQKFVKENYDQEKVEVDYKIVLK